MHESSASLPRVAFVAAFPANPYLIARGRDRAVVYQHRDH